MRIISVYIMVAYLARMIIIPLLPSASILLLLSAFVFVFNYVPDVSIEDQAGSAGHPVFHNGKTDFILVVLEEGPSSLVRGNPQDSLGYELLRPSLLAKRNFVVFFIRLFVLVVFFIRFFVLVACTLMLFCRILCP